MIFHLISPVSGLELKSIELSDHLYWTLETTSGWQNITNTMTKEEGDSTQLREGLNFNGILFHSYWEGIQTLKAQLNLGFKQLTKFLWTDSPNINNGENTINENLRCSELDIQATLPYRLYYAFIISPFIGYSFINYSYNATFSSDERETVMYNSLVLGMSATHKVNKVFTQTAYVSYSPLVFENYSKSKTQFINFGLEVKTDTHPISITLFMNSKYAFLQKGRLIFEGTDFNFTTAEAGFSFHMNLR